MQHAERNRALFAARFAPVMARLDRLPEPAARPIRDASGRVINIDLGIGLLFPADEPQWSAAQVESHQTEPDRIVFGDPSHCNLSPVSHVLHEHLRRYLWHAGHGSGLAAAPLRDAGYAFVFGIGLGYQLSSLVATTRARRLVLIEPFPEFLVYSFDAIDWTSIVETADARGIGIDFVFGDDPGSLTRSLEAIVGHHGNSFIEGSEFFASYYSWVLEETYRQLRLALKTYYITSGFFEDEMSMMENTIGNLTARSFSLIERRRHIEQSFPVFLVGAGPSLDEDMQHIRRLRHRAVVVSCGTAIGILLKNGIRPDLHCELERGELVYRLLEPLSRQYDFAGIGLIASTTVDPRIGDLFERRWLFFRSPLSPSKLLVGRSKPLIAADPLCCNAALSAMAALGFKTFCLFGLDLGQRQTGRHHARDSVYYAAEHADLDTEYRRRFDRRVPGNFGGEVETWWAFDIARRCLDQVQRQMGLEMINCSDGARIDGARPKAAAALALPTQVEPVERLLRRVEAQMRACAAGELLAEAGLDGHLAACDRYLDGLDRLLAGSRGGDGSFFAFDRAFSEQLVGGGDDHLGFLAIGQASARAMIRLGHFFGSRISDDAARARYFEHFLDAFRERNAAMAAAIQQQLRGKGGIAAAAE